MVLEKKFVVAAEKFEDITTCSKHELVEIGGLGYYIRDASGELTYYYYKSLSVVSETG